MDYCENCGYEAHCGTSLYKEHRDVWDNHRGQIKVCDMCRCEECTIEEISFDDYIVQHKKHENESTSTNLRNKFWKKRKLKND